MNRFRPGCNSKEPMSPGDDGARLTHPPPPSAVNVFIKKFSPPIIRRIPPNSPPPPVPVFIATPCCATIAPVSAFTDSPGARLTVSSE